MVLARTVGTAIYHRDEPATIVSNAHDISPLPLGRRVSMLRCPQSAPRPKRPPSSRTPLDPRDRLDQAVFRYLLGGELAHDAAMIHGDDAVGDVEDLGHLG